MRQSDDKPTSPNARQKAFQNIMHREIEFREYTTKILESLDARDRCMVIRAIDLWNHQQPEVKRDANSVLMIFEALADNAGSVH